MALKTLFRFTVVVAAIVLQSSLLFAQVSPPPPDPPGAPELDSPADGADDISLEPTLQWSAVDSADTYQVQMAEEDDFDDLVANEDDIESTSWTSETLDFETTYYWRVRGVNNGAGDGTGDDAGDNTSEGEWSTVWSFTTESEPPPPPPDPPVAPDPPGAPELASPADGADDISLEPTLQWSAVDSADTYQVQMAEEDDFDDLVANEDDIESTSWTSGTLDFETTYYWRVRGVNNGAGDGTGDDVGDNTSEGEWSTVWSFTTESEPAPPPPDPPVAPDPPGAPELASPADGADDISLEPTLQWSAVDSADTYQLQLSEDDDFDDLIANEDEIESTSWTSGALNFETTYYWRVRGVNDDAGAGEWSTTRDFTTEEEPEPDPPPQPDPPEAPELESPSDGAEDVSLEPTLEWSAVDSADTYQLQLSEDDDFDDLIANEDDVESTSWTSGTLDFETTYYWHVRGVNNDTENEEDGDDAGDGEWSTIWSFTTESEPPPPPPDPPEAPSLTAPADNAEGVSRKPTLAWNSVEEADSYHLQLDDSASFNRTVADENGIGVTSWQPTDSLGYNSIYFWRVRAVSNNAGPGEWSDRHKFKTEETPPPPPEAPEAPEAPELESPSDGDEDVSLEPTLEWDSVDDVDTYQLQLSEDDDFDDLIANEDEIESTSWTSGTLNFETTYYWRVRGHNNGAGDDADEDTSEGEWSAVWSFTTQEEPEPDPPDPPDPPNAPELESPSDGAEDVSLEPTLEWNSVDDADAYQLQLAEDDDFDDLIANEDEIESTSWTSGTLDFETTYYWRVRAIRDGSFIENIIDIINGAEQNGEWSEVRSFTTEKEPEPDPPPQPDPPVAPEMASPADGADDISLEPTLEWDSVDDADAYQLQLAEDDDFDDLIANEDEIESTSWSSGTLNFETTYYWRVRGINDDTGAGEWSKTRNFTTREEPEPDPPDPPGQPELISPTNGARDVIREPTLRWNAVDNADSYRLQLASGRSFNNPVTDEDDIESTSWTSGTLDYNTTYYWRVRAENSEVGPGDWSSVRAFTTDEEPAPDPPAPPDPPQATLSILSPVAGTILVTPGDVTIEWEISGEISELDIFYSTDDGNTWAVITESLDASTNSYSWQVAEIVSNSTRIRISGSGGDNLIAVSDPFILYPEQTELTVEYQFNESPSSTDYRLISVPGNDPMAVNQLFTGTQKEDWNVFFDNGADVDYLVEFDASDVFQLKPGNAFWAISTQPVNFIKRTESVTLSADTTYTIPLHPGWNLISNPFTRTVSWPHVQELNELENPIWSFDTSFSQSNQMKPYQGYYFYNLEEKEEIKIPWPTEASLPIENQMVEPSHLIDVAIFSNNRRKSSVRLGFHNRADGTVDTLQYHAPPGDLLDYHMTLIEPEASENDRQQQYAAEYRRESETIQTYNIRLTAAESTPITFKTESTGHFSGREIILVSNETGKTYDLNSENPVRFLPVEGINEFTLITGSTAEAEEAARQLLPETPRLSQNYPNPFNSETTIEYIVPLEETVTHVHLEVFDVQGRRVGILVDEVQVPGPYSVTWNGNEFASGIYYYRLRIGDRVTSLSMLLIK